MGNDGQTDIGGLGGTFLTTHWSLIGDIQAGDTRDNALIGLLVERYWKPVYCYLRRKGYSNEEAKDLTQGFFHTVVLNRNLVQRADQSKGHFRTYLLHALNQYVINESAKQTAGKRIPKDKLVPLDVLDPPAVPAAVLEAGPEDCYHYAWMSALMDQVLETVRIGCRDEGLENHWHVFNEKVVQPILNGVGSPSLADLSARYGIADPRQASNMIVTVKRRFRSALREHVRTTVIAEDQVDDELAEILRFLPDMAQDSK
jgi:RNA polymerase sigma-70 factor (ECF subfamily)